VGKNLLRMGGIRYVKDALLFTQAGQDEGAVQEGNRAFILRKREAGYRPGKKDADDIPIFPDTL